MATFDTNTASQDFRKKKMLLEALRRRQTALSATPDMAATVSTGATGAYPGSTQVNYGGILANAAKAFANARVNRQADATEAEMQAAREQALSEITPESVERLTPQQALRLQEMGVDVGALKAFQPKKEPIANLMQHLGEFTEVDAPMLAQLYGQDEAQIRTMIQSAAANKKAADQAAFEREKTLKTLGIQPPKKSEFELYQENPEAYAKFAALKGSAGGDDAYAKTLKQKQAAADVNALQGLPQLDTVEKMVGEMELQDTQDAAAGKPEPFLSGGKLKTLSAMGQAVGFNNENDLATIPDEANALAQKANTLALQASDVFKGQGAVTESERAILAKTKILPTDTRAQRLAKYKIIKDAIASGKRKMAEAAARVNKAAPEMAPPLTTPTAPGSGGAWSVRVRQ